eukprot:COSAG01_NODE_221_length_21422_cov_48.284294_3_plen_65_part_00
MSTVPCQLPASRGLLAQQTFCTVAANFCVLHDKLLTLSSALSALVDSHCKYGRFPVYTPVLIDW